MGTWGTGPLDNDTALDALITVAEEGTAAVTRLLREASEDASDADPSMSAIGIGEVLAAHLSANWGRVGEHDRERLRPVFSGLSEEEVDGMRALAVSAIDEALDASDSELRELWDEAQAGLREEWLKTTRALREELVSHALAAPQ